jgi:hypothetical protein
VGLEGSRQTSKNVERKGLSSKIPARPTSICDTHIKSISSYFPQNIQLLIHPIWWIFEESSTEFCWNQALLSNFEELQQQLIDTEKAYGLKRNLSLEPW